MHRFLACLPPLRLTAWLALTNLLFVTGTAAAALAAPADANDPKWCRNCHQEEQFSAKIHKASAHGEQACNDCHTGYQFNPHEPVEEVKSETADALKKRGIKHPEPLAACTDCHDSPSAVPGAMPHGKQKDGLKAGLPYCIDCHGDPHTIQKRADVPKNDWRKHMNEHCIKCHGDEKKMAPVKQRADVVEGYEHTMHFTKLSLGSPDAPGCADCHPVHPPQSVTETEARAAGPCAKCHQGADKDFQKLAGHKGITAEDRPVSFWTIRFFGWLTFLTILGLSLHVLLDLVNVIRRARREATEGKPHQNNKVDTDKLHKASGGRVGKDGTVLRFDGQQRAAHGLMALSFSTLVLTGWPLSTRGIGASHSLVALFGGLQQLGWLHRAAAIGLIVAALLHVTYLVQKLLQKKLQPTMLPAPRDVMHLAQNLAWFLGFAKERPRYGRYTYFEKFDYWAVFWGCVIMVGSGAVRWFPSTIMKYAPTWVYEIAWFAHTDEALLAALAIFVWHFYNVHLRPSIFPMSWVFLTGRMSLHDYAEEHADEHDKWVKEAQKADEAPQPPIAEQAAAAEPSAAKPTAPEGGEK